MSGRIRAVYRGAALAAAIAAVWLGGACKEVPLTAPEGAELSMTANPSSIRAEGGASRITVVGFKAQEDGGGPLPDGTQVFLTTDLGIIEERVVMENGIARATLRSDGRSGTATVTARSGSGIAAESVTVEIGLSGEVNVTVTANPATLGPFDVTSEIIATVTDANGNPIEGAPVIFSTTAGSLASAGTVLRTNENGQAFDRLTLLDTADTATVTATSGTSTAQVTVTRGNFGDPVIDSLSPFSAPAGSALTVTLNGARFRGGATVSFGAGIAVDDVTWINSETLRAAIRISPDATTGARTVTVRNADGTSGTLTNGFLVTAGGGGGGGPVNVTSVSPTDASPGDTLSVTVSGSGFQSGAVVGFGAGISVNSVTFVSSSQLTANITVGGAATGGPRDVSVVNPDSTSDTLPGGFTVIVPPTVSSVTPTNGNPGDTILSVEVNGANFQSGASVDFGAGITVTQVFFFDPTLLFVDITIDPAATPGSRTVTVTNPDGGSDALAGGFTVN